MGERSFWIRPTLSELLEWCEAEKDDGAEIEISIRVAVDGDPVMENVWRWHGYEPITREMAVDLNDEETVASYEQLALEVCRRPEVQGEIEALRAAWAGLSPAEIQVGLRQEVLHEQDYER